ncbi:hypothetical protein ACJJIF_16415 [Microbulbifer sp. SSSA002]|uniref:hypothetical protein n=1 Tax=Microbulbifer sp. SSSA002 TaxID=3243376 RepID=UPI004039C210
MSDCLHNNEHFNDCLPAPYAKLNEIEWILIPSQFEAPYSDKKRPLPNIFNDIEAIRVHLEKYANFPIIEVENGIKIIGYEY